MTESFFTVKIGIQLLVNVFAMVIITSIGKRKSNETWLATMRLIGC